MNPPDASTAAAAQALFWTARAQAEMPNRGDYLHADAGITDGSIILTDVSHDTNVPMLVHITLHLRPEIARTTLPQESLIAFEPVARRQPGNLYHQHFVSARLVSTDNDRGVTVQTDPTIIRGFSMWQTHEYQERFMFHSHHVSEEVGKNLLMSERPLLYGFWNRLVDTNQQHIIRQSTRIPSKEGGGVIAAPPDITSYDRINTANYCQYTKRVCRRDAGPTIILQFKRELFQLRALLRKQRGNLFCEMHSSYDTEEYTTFSEFTLWTSVDDLIAAENDPDVRCQREQVIMPLCEASETEKSLWQKIERPPAAGAS